MANIQMRSSVVAIKKETTEGTPVVPSAGTSAIAFQADFGIEPATDELENEEIRASIGSTKGIIGAETPKASMSHYLRHSGTEGTAPNYGPLLESFFGSVVTAGTEYDTTSGSSVTGIAFPSGEGSNFQRGQALLLKDTTNGYRIRAIHSMSTDTAVLGFKVPTAPASGVNTGKCVLYKPANSGHPAVTLWQYLGNGSGVQMISGGRVTSLSMDLEAGDLLNMKYDIEGLSYYYNPIEITSSTKYLDFTDDDGTYAAILTVKWYKTPKDLAAAISAAMDAANPGETHTCVYNDSTGTFTITSTGTLLSLLFNSGNNTANSIAAKIGFSTAADNTGTGASTGYTGSAINLAFAYTASYDAADPISAKYHEVMIGDTTDYTCFEASKISINGTLERAGLKSICAETGVAGSLITGRDVEITVTARLQSYDADKIYRYFAASSTRFQYSFGPKVGGNWVAGKCGYAYMPTGVVKEPKISDEDGVAIIEFKMKGFVDDSGNGEFYMGFV